MNAQREPVLLAVLIQPASFSWHVGGIRRDGETVPLMRSEQGNLDHYRGLEADAQRSFLRHRIAGVLQRGCDRLFARNMKADRFLLIADRHFPDAAEALTAELAEHLSQWMINPPLTYLLAPPSFTCDSPEAFQLVAGELSDAVSRELCRGIPRLVAELRQPDCWELVVRPQQSL